MALDEEIAHVSGQFERIAVGHDNVGDLADLDRPDLIREAENLRGIERDAL